MKKQSSSIILVIVFFIGLSLLLYPSVSDYWNSFHQSRAIATYAEEVAEMDDGQYELMLSKARIYNSELFQHKNGSWVLTEEEKEEYNSNLDINGSGIMGYIEIPSIRCSLPIYHGTDEAVLQIGVGHIEGSSLPIGGESTHAVLSSHRGLPSAKLFTNLDKLVEGDIFQIRVLDEVLTYEVDQILIVLPDEMDALKIEEGKDYCTLVTCTPYGVNSHRLLVRGHRIETTENYVQVTADAIQIDAILVAPAIAAPILLVLLIWVLVRYRKPKKKNQNYRGR